MESSNFLRTYSMAAGALLLFTFLTALTMNKVQRELIWKRFRSQRRKASGSKTPPRSFSPEKKAVSHSESKTCTATSQDLTKSFPPSRRGTLPRLAESASTTDRAILLAPEPAQDFLRDALLPTTHSYILQHETPRYTPTGFSTEEITAIGDFPSYDILSGVPLPDPYENFCLERALPRPYRPFRWAYHQTMSLTKMESNWWLEIENSYASKIRERRGLYSQYGKLLLDYLPGSELACKELMEMCLQFYCARYPALFTLREDKRTFHNAILNETTDITSIHPLLVLLNNVPEDFAIVLRNENDGQYYFRAGVICSSLGWNVSTKIGLCLSDIHEPIPDYKEKMALSMNRYFSKMPTDAPIQRGSWGLEVGTPLFMPPGDPHEKLREYQKDDLTIDDCHLRVDWQTLRRLPLSGAVVFNFTGLFTPVSEFRDEPYIPALLLKILRDGKSSLMEYKNTWHVEHVCIPALEQYAREQVEKGLVKPENPEDETWAESTLAESPYFPGWEEKWHRQQGF